MARILILAAVLLLPMARPALSQTSPIAVADLQKHIVLTVPHRYQSTVRRIIDTHGTGLTGQSIWIAWLDAKVEAGPRNMARLMKVFKDKLDLKRPTAPATFFILMEQTSGGEGDD